MKLFSEKVILIVEDEEMLRGALKDILESKGATVLEAENGKSAFEVLKVNQVDLMISDVRMPGGDGLSLVRQIHSELNYQPKMFLCTGFSDVTKEEAKKFGVIDIFPKPFSVKVLIQKLADAFGIVNASV